MKLLCQPEVHSKSREVCRSQGARLTLSDTFFVPLWRIYGGHKDGGLDFTPVDSILGRVVPSS